MTKHIRPIRIDGNIAYVALTKGHEAIIDAVDVPLVDAYNWRALVTPHTVYAIRSIRDGGKDKTVYLHRDIMGDPKGLEVDHRDANGLNNRRHNLREATPSQNRQNQRIRSNNVSGLKGVHFHKNGGKWRAMITVGRKQKHLGLFDTQEQARAAYANASRELHGEFGRAV